MACLDTTILVDLVRRRGPRKQRAVGKLRGLAQRDEKFVTTRLNIAELYVGVERSDNPRRELGIVESLLAELGVLDFDDRSARLFGQITAHLQRLGRPAGDMDVLIAATCLAAGHRLVTRDSEHFANVPGLTVESY